MNENFLKQYIGKILVGSILVLLICLIGSLVYTTRTSEKNTLNTAIATSEGIIEQFKVLRGYYAGNVVKKVKKGSDMKISYDHATMDDAIPLPATLIHDLSKLLEEKDNIKLNLYSEYPFPNRANRTLDDFAKGAIKAFKVDSDKPYIETTKIDGENVVRVALADKMVAESCVNCHNSRADTPKDNWKLGDVRGVLEVTIPINAARPDMQRNQLCF